MTNQTPATLKGTVTKIRQLTFEPAPLVRFTLETSEQNYNCLIRTSSLNFLYEVTEGSTISLYGIFNKRNQLVIKKYTAERDKFLYDFSHYKHHKYEKNF